MHAPDLSGEMAYLDKEEARAVMLAIVEWVVPAGFDAVDSRLAVVLTDLRRGDRPSAEARDGVQALFDELDVVAWDIRDELTESDSPEEYSRAFSNARAVNAVWYACGEPSVEMARECAYEAEVAKRNDVQGLTLVVRSALQGSGGSRGAS